MKKDKDIISEYITVLDFMDSTVYQYKIEIHRDLIKEGYFGDYCEEYLTNKGHNLSNCEWMVHDVKKPSLIKRYTIM